MRTDAEKVHCPHCHAPAGETCHRPEPHTGVQVPLDHLPAHTARIAAAANTQEING
uniref:zinc finger domain-containing protein n=1 Tax=Micromonospora sp. NBC_00855 TaxID=2975978 RepID=UPI0037CA6390